MSAEQLEQSDKGLHCLTFLLDCLEYFLLILIILAGDIKMNPGPMSLCRLCTKYCKTSEKSVNCECEKHFHTSCINLDKKELLELESGNKSWYCTNC